MCAIKSACSSGFSALELMACITISAVLLGIGVPIFADVLSRNKVTAQSEVLLSSLNMARETAIAQATNVIICRHSDRTPGTCNRRHPTGADWSNGWLVYADIDANNRLSDADTTIAAGEQMAEVKIIFNQRGRLRFFPDGTARSAGFYLCDRQNSRFRHIKILHSGRTRLSEMDDRRKKTICEQPSDEK